jgi:Protein of unknown function (DUF1499)
MAAALIFPIAAFAGHAHGGHHGGALARSWRHPRGHGYCHGMGVLWRLASRPQVLWLAWFRGEERSGAALVSVGANGLRTAMAKVIASEPKITLMDAEETALTEPYVQRSGLLAFPDTIVVRYIERPEGRSTLAIYSRSQLGQSDLGVNIARLKRWLGELERIVPVIR